MHARWALLGLLGLFAPPAAAALFTVGGFSFDDQMGANTVTILQGDVVTRRSGFIPGPGFDINRGLGDLLLAGQGDTTPRVRPRFVELGDQNSVDQVEMIELNVFHNRVIRNSLPGDDFVVFENGLAGRPEPFAVSFKVIGQDWSPWRYEFADTYTSDIGSVPGGAVQVFATGFDLGTFGFGPGNLLTHVRLRNLINGDLVSEPDGFGWLGGSFAPQTGPLGTGDFTFGPPGQWDPDITFVAGLAAPFNPALAGAPHMPEPGTWALLGAGALLLRRRRR